MAPAGYYSYSNAAPTITLQSEFVMAENTVSPPLAVTVGDDQTGLASLTVTADSSDHLVMPPGAMRLGGTGANRTLTLTPAANRTGSVVITLTVSDGTRTGSGTCKLTIQPTSAPTGVSPAIAIGSDRGKSCGHGLNLAGLLVAIALYRLRRRGGEGNKDGWP